MTRPLDTSNLPKSDAASVENIAPAHGPRPIKRDEETKTMAKAEQRPSKHDTGDNSRVGGGQISPAKTVIPPKTSTPPPPPPSSNKQE